MKQHLVDVVIENGRVITSETDYVASIAIDEAALWLSDRPRICLAPKRELMREAK